ncbi:hypothetical protein SGFS_004800 [Streptomyces graminofaciens]|uniref:Uncharacterized protein n=1 Tax=Streptomyces graminofaciens TaxID=68212 RepID=A0ABN5V7K7_9ACTN|nr:hypothetical protein [Streptomyces graminofaciens]BBC29189.1 hypothetical protein SGFS_004800 [Streptomyces graminofaciens]
MPTAMGEGVMHGTGTDPPVDGAGPLVRLASYQTSAARRRLGTARLTRWLRARGVRSPEELAKKVVEAAERQHTSDPGEAVIAQLARTLAQDVETLNKKLERNDRVQTLGPDLGRGR